MSTSRLTSLGVALENVRLFERDAQRLLAETEQRNGELAVINSVQQGLASKLEMQAIIDLVGDKLCEVVSSDSLDIRLYDRQANLVLVPLFCRPREPDGAAGYRAGRPLSPRAAHLPAACNQ